MGFEVMIIMNVVYDALNSWWQQSENVMKHVNASINEIDEIMDNPKFQTNLDNCSKGDVR